MSHMAEPERKKKSKKKAELLFDDTKTFDVKPNVELELDEESSQFKAKKGEGGDRRG
jgi:hypothetical protein